MPRKPLLEPVGTPPQLAELAENEAHHRRLLRVGLGVALTFHLGLLLIPLPQRGVVVAEKEMAPVLQLLPIPKFYPPPSPAATSVRPSAHPVPVPEVFLPEPVADGREIQMPLAYEVDFIDEPAPPPPPEADAEGRVYVGGRIAQPARLVYAEPVYPRSALLARRQGTVFLQVLLGKDGSIKEVTVLRPASTGMTEAAIEAVREWRYEPALLNGRPVEAWMSVTVNFTLR